jgi:hypothetical protein
LKPNSTKNTALLKQYPFVADIIKMPLEPTAQSTNHPYNYLDDLAIKVEKADGDLMLRRADNVGLGDYSCVFHITGKRQDQVMRRAEYVFAIGENDKIINRLNFPRNDEEQRRVEGEIYAWMVLFASKMRNASNTGNLYTDALCDKTKYMVWVTVEAWHMNTRNDNSPGARFGEFCDRAMHITIYSAPEEGFAKLQENASPYSNLFLDSRMMTRGVLNKNYDVVTIGGMLYEMCITFQDEVYFNGMKEVLDNGKHRGASGQFGSVKVLCAEMCGYDRVMLEDATSWVSFQLRPGSKYMYVLGQQGTLPQIRNLVRTVVKAWNEKPELRDSFTSDKEVSVI